MQIKFTSEIKSTKYYLTKGVLNEKAISFNKRTGLKPIKTDF
jgi:hypothetical protein